MSGKVLVFRHSATKGWALMLFGSVPLFLSAVLAIKAFGSDDAPLVPIGCFGCFGLLLLGLGIRLAADRAPKLTVDATGITDHTCSRVGRRIEWANVQGIEKGQMRLPGDLGDSLCLILYVRNPGGEVTTHGISILDLEGGPVHVQTEVKRLWLAAASAPRPERPPEPP